MRQPALVGNVPTMLTPLVGREQDVANVCDLLGQQEVRLLTLFGTGGVGKTRLAIQVATEMRERFADGVCFVLLAALHEPELVLSAIAEALDIQESGEQSLFAQVTGVLQRKHLLLVLDNIEQVIVIAPQLEDILAVCPLLKIVVTSREVLRVPAEQVYPVLPLALPDLKQLHQNEDLSRYTAIALFIQRAHSLLPTFQPTAASTQAIAEICVRLDGLPLAIEIAAAHIRLFSPQALLSRLTPHLEPLKHSMRTVPARHQTLRSTLDWSYNLLSKDEQRLFRALSIFVGGWTLAPVEAVWQQEDDTSPEPLNALEGVASLLNKSLLIQTGQEGEEPRLLMLATVREYGLSLLRESGEFERVREAHALYYLAWVEQVEPRLKGQQQMHWKALLEQEQENLRAALQWCIELERTELACRFGAALGWFWYISGHWGEGRRWLEAAFQLPQHDVPLVAWARALCSAGALASCQGDYPAARAWIEESVVLLRAMQNAPDLAFALSILGAIIADNDVVTSRTLAQEGVALARATGERWNLAFALYLQGLAIASPGSYADAVALLEQSLALFRQLEDKRQLTYALAQLGNIVAAQGDMQRAETLCRESLALARELGYRPTLLRTVYELAKVLRQRGDTAQATLLFQESIVLTRDLGDRCLEAMIMQELAYIARAQHDIAQATALLRESLLLYREMDETFLQVGAVCELGSLALAQGDSARALEMYTESMTLTQQIGQQPEQVLAFQAEMAPLLTASVQPSNPLLTPVAPDMSSTFGLTPREIDVLRLVSRGFTNAQIAEQLIVSPLTVNAHVRSIYNKLDVTTRSAATRLAIEQQLV